MKQCKSFLNEQPVTGRRNCGARWLVALLAVAMLMQSCGGVAEKSVNLDLSVETGDVYEKDLVHVARWVELDKAEPAMITKAKKVVKSGGEYYILDNIGKKRVIVFGKDGKYSRSIGNTGGGPGEYPDIVDFCVNEENGNIGILSTASEFYLYNREGAFIESRKMTESLLWECACVGNHYVFTTDHSTFTEGENAKLIYVYDGSLQEVGRYVSVLPVQMPQLDIFNGQLVSTGKEGYYMDVFTNTLYGIGAPTFGADTICNISLPNPMPTEIYAGGMTFFENQINYDWIMGFVPTATNYILNYIKGGEMKIAIFNHDMKVVKNGNFLGLFPRSFPTSTDTIVSTVTLDEYFGFWSTSENYKECGMPKMTDESNMLLMEWTIGS